MSGKWKGLSPSLINFLVFTALSERKRKRQESGGVEEKRKHAVVACQAFPLMIMSLIMMAMA